MRRIVTYSVIDQHGSFRRQVNCTDRKVRVIGEMALVTGRAAIEAEIGGQPRSLKLLFLNAWAKTPQGWRFVTTIVITNTITQVLRSSMLVWWPMLDYSYCQPSASDSRQTR
jgi:hypothetical protein